MICSESNFKEKAFNMTEKYSHNQKKKISKDQRIFLKIQPFPQKQEMLHHNF